MFTHNMMNSHHNTYIATIKENVGCNIIFFIILENILFLYLLQSRAMVWQRQIYCIKI